MTTKRYHISPLLLSVAAALLLAAAVAAPARAAAVDQDQAREILERNEEYLQRVHQLVVESESEQARQIFENAVRKQQHARTFFQRGRYVLAVQTSASARQVGSQAERLARGSGGARERVLQKLERMGDLRDQVVERATDARNPQALALVRQAENLYQRARTQYQQTRYEQAWNLIQQSEETLKRAARIVLAGGDAERLQEEQDRIDGMIASARERLDGATDPALARQLDRAVRTLGDARLALTSDQPLRALRLTRRALTDAQKILRQLGGALSAASVQREIDRFDARQSELTEAGNGADDLLRRAAARRDEAEAMLLRGEKEGALRIIRAALNLQRQAGERTR